MAGFSTDLTLILPVLTSFSFPLHSWICFACSFLPRYISISTTPLAFFATDRCMSCVIPSMSSVVPRYQCILITYRGASRGSHERGSSLSDLQLVACPLPSAAVFQGKKGARSRPWAVCIQKAVIRLFALHFFSWASVRGREGLSSRACVGIAEEWNIIFPKTGEETFTVSVTPSVKPLVKQNRGLTISSMRFSFFLLILFSLYAFFHSFSIPTFSLLIFFICQKISFLLPQISFLFLLLMWLFSVSLSTLRAYFSLFTVFATWRSAIEKWKVDCMGISYFSFSSRSPFLFPPISVKFTILKCFRPLLPNHFTHLSLSCSVLPPCLPLRLLLDL